MLKKLAKAIIKETDPETRRFRIISPIVANKELLNNRRKLNKRIKAIAADCGISEKTVSRWIKAYCNEGFKGLVPKYPKVRTDKRLYVSYEALFDEAKLMRMQSPTISVNDIIKCLESRHPALAEIGVLKRSTLQHHLMKAGYSRRELLNEREKNGRAFFGQYRKAHRLEQVQGDIKEPPKGSCVDDNGNSVVPYVQLWMDNSSRMILSYRISTHQSEDIALSSLRQLIETYGIPETILTDQGSIYRGSSFCHCTHALGITHRRSKPYQPQSKGALERLNGTVDDLFIPIKGMKNVRFSVLKKLVEQRIFEYNRTKHSALVFIDENNKEYILSPQEVFEKDTKVCRLADPQILEYAFKLHQSRRVSKDGLISFRGKNYVVPSGLAKAGEMVSIIYSLTDHSVELAVCNSEEEIKNGGEEYLFYELHELEVKPDVNYEEVFRKNHSEEKEALRKQAANQQIPPNVERLMREISKRENTYQNEEQFQRDILPTITWVEQDIPNAEQSIYGTVTEQDTKDNTGDSGIKDTSQDDKPDEHNNTESLYGSGDKGGDNVH